MAVVGFEGVELIDKFGHGQVFFAGGFLLWIAQLLGQNVRHFLLILSINLVRQMGAPPA